MMQLGVETCLAQLQTDPNVKGLLLWLLGREMPFPMDLTASKFDAIRQALLDKDLQAFEAVALSVIGLGQGLTPSGDDFLGGLFYASQEINWGQTPINLLKACRAKSHPKSAAVLADLMEGVSTGPLQHMLCALSANDAVHIQSATQALYSVGSSSGADMLAGVLTYLSTQTLQKAHQL